MKQQILERARSTEETFRHKQCADTTLSVLSVNPEVDGYGDGFLLIHLAYDDGNDAKGLPDSLVRIRPKARLRTELKSGDVEAFPVVSFTAESEVGEDPERLLQAEADDAAPPWAASVHRLRWSPVAVPTTLGSDPYPRNQRESTFAYQLLPITTTPAKVTTCPRDRSESR